jgi:predicted 2-oxoglutarate/Fe(II)-dependent dioxygenase YbiX
MGRCASFFQKEYCDDVSHFADLTPEDVASFSTLLQQGEWVDGRLTVVS